MKRKSLIKLASLGMLLTIASSCDKAENKTVDVSGEVKVADASALTSFRVYSGGSAFVLQESAKDFKRPENVVFTDTISMVVPMEVMGKEVPELNKAIFEAAFETVEATPEETIRQNLGVMAAQSGYELKTVNKSDCNPKAVRGKSEIKGEVFTLSADYLIYRVGIYSYMPGAAHGMYMHKYVNYSIAHDKIITLNDLFTSDGLAKLPKFLSDEATLLRAQYGKLDIKELPSEGNFYIGGMGEVVFVYQPCEVASYSRGVVTIPVQPRFLKDFMSDFGKSLCFKD